MLGALRVTLEPDDGGRWVAVLAWVEIVLDERANVMRIEAQPFEMLIRIAIN